MSKKICKLEKETSSWKQRWERSHNALLEMGADKQKSEQELVVVSRQLATLQGLCRTLQAERATLTAKLKILQGNFHLWSEYFKYLFKRFPLVHIKFGGCNLLWTKNYCSSHSIFIIISQGIQKFLRLCPCYWNGAYNQKIKIFFSTTIGDTLMKFLHNMYKSVNQLLN